VDLVLARAVDLDQTFGDDRVQSAADLRVKAISSEETVGGLTLPQQIAAECVKSDTHM
jgi:hypothetical protein